MKACVGSVNVRNDTRPEPDAFTSVIVSVCDSKTPHDTWHEACAEAFVQTVSP